ncbi:dihydropteroate synthase [Kineococcus rhizosphaerae]|uniref:Dihydropteroate synthase n=1 Tax=Kineococcus rhizosphaerae TaxID=559628 RepID=A0A2T0R5J8_9ACTN|nr:dihydropteroate synthase [Kineococcus rhizosphaerae]PRY16041.1 dihydropteroate synthase [Kineococcus rhizosphaerae]
MNPLLTPGPTRVLGVLNVTPDSFSDGGRHLAHPDAVARGVALHAAGADLVDVGGESTRPGATRVEAAEELRRVLPVVEGLVAAGVPVSVDTMRAATARAVVAAGALVVNDVSGGLADEDMAATVAGLDCVYVLSHWRGFSDVMNSLAVYADPVAEVRAELAGRLAAVTAAGVARDRVVLDPGLGFAKTAEHDWSLLAGLDELAALGCPLLVGASRKRFLGSLLAAGGEVPAPADRDAATAAVSALAAARGVWGVRVHDVPSTVAAVKVAAAWSAAGRGSAA